LTPDAVDDTLRFLAEHSGPGSSIVFDWLYPSLLTGAPRHGEVRKMRRYRWLSGEQLAFGILEGMVTAVLEAHGFHRVRNAGHVALDQAYFSHGSRKRIVADGYAIAYGDREAARNDAERAEDL
jgi:O-methyltransferase involved in polyketide biosynthesis